MGKTFTPGESLVRKLVGGLLWGVSTSLSINLFLSFSGGDWITMIVLIVMAIGLEGAKILTWKAGGSQKILAWVLIGLSVLASFGAALQLINRQNDQYQKQVVNEDMSLIEGKALDYQIQDLENRLKSIPSTWLTWYRSLSSDLEKLREKRQDLNDASNNSVKFEETLESLDRSIFEDLSEFTHWDRRILVLTVLMTMAIALEWGALVLASSSTIIKTTKKITTKEIMEFSSEIFLAKMIELGDGDYLGGRDRAGKELGWPTYQTKKCYSQLQKDRKILRSGDRTVLSSR